MNAEETVKRLRSIVILDEVRSDNQLANEAADLIERQAKALEEAEKALETFAKAPTHGQYGGPMVGASVFYEDETEQRAGKFYRLSAVTFANARAAIATIRALKNADQEYARKLLGGREE